MCWKRVNCYTFTWSRSFTQFLNLYALDSVFKTKNCTYLNPNVSNYLWSTLNELKIREISPFYARIVSSRIFLLSSLCKTRRFPLYFPANSYHSRKTIPEILNQSPLPNLHRQNPRLNRQSTKSVLKNGDAPEEVESVTCLGCLT